MGDQSRSPEGFYDQSPYQTVPNMPSSQTHPPTSDCWNSPDLADSWSATDLRTNINGPNFRGSLPPPQQASPGIMDGIASGPIDVKPAIQAAALAGYSGKVLSCQTGHINNQSPISTSRYMC